jgi:small subunit ribosomal protein S16
LLRIRLRRTGKKKQPSYRIVVADSRAPRDGSFVETIGTYNPLNQPSVIALDEDRARHWLERGARPSERVSKILAIQGIAEIPPKLQTRIELGKKRLEEAKSKPKDEAPPAQDAPSSEPVASAAEESPAEPEAPSGDTTAEQQEPDSETEQQEPE